MSGHRRRPIIAVSHTNNRDRVDPSFPSTPKSSILNFCGRGVWVWGVSAWRQGTETEKRESKKGDSPDADAVWATLSHGLLVAWEEGDSSILFSLPPTMIFSPTSLSALRMTGENMRQPHQFLKFNEKGSGAETCRSERVEVDASLVLTTLLVGLMLCA